MGISRLELRESQPTQQREDRHAAQEMRGDDRRLEEHGDRPCSQRRLEDHERENRCGKPFTAAGAPSGEGENDDKNTQGAGKVAVAHFLPCLDERIAVGDVGGRGLAIAKRPVGAAEACVRQAHVGAGDDDHEGQNQTYQDQSPH